MRKVADTVAQCVDPLAKDEKLRRRVAATLAAALAAQQQARKQTGTAGIARRLASDRRFRAQVDETVTQLQAAQKRANRVRSHRMRNSILVVGGIGMIATAIPSLRKAVASLIRGLRDVWAPSDRADSSMNDDTTIDEQIEVAVPISVAYNQWTQFEEFPRFMEGVDEVRQLDDTLLHWAATVGGKHAEWDAKILEQEPDRRISWESIDGKHTRGTVSFEDAGPGRSRIRLHMSYTPEGAAERVGSAMALDNRRIRGDLERFRDLVEGLQAETGSWRGEIKHGRKTSSAPET
jgi:uncharacterized membrane protein